MPIEQVGDPQVKFPGLRLFNSSTISNTFTMEWPPGSGRQIEFPEIDRAEFFDAAGVNWALHASEGAFFHWLWLPDLKCSTRELYERLKKRGEELGIPDFPDMIADETVGTTEDEVLEFLTAKGHPCLTMEALF